MLTTLIMRVALGVRQNHDHQVMLVFFWSFLVLTPCLDDYLQELVTLHPEVEEILK